jgi:H+/Cl- antiporter ClcA
MSKVLLALGVVAALFGWWGVYTAAGRQQFDEMAGIIPLVSFALGGLLLVIGVALLFWRR